MKKIQVQENDRFCRKSNNGGFLPRPYFTAKIGAWTNWSELKSYREQLEQSLKSHLRQGFQLKQQQQKQLQQK